MSATLATPGPFRESRLALHLALGFVAILFSANYILGKIALAHFDPLAFAWLRVSGSFLCLILVYLRHTTPRVPFSKTEWRLLVVYSLLGIVLNQILFISGLARTTAQHAAILIVTIPVFTLLIALILRRETASPARLVGILLAAGGALSIILRSADGSGAASLTGDVMILANSLFYAAYLVLSKPLMARHSAIRVMTLLFAFGTVLMIPFSAQAMLNQAWSGITGSAWLALFLVILGPTVGAYLINGWALARADSSLVAAYVYLQPLLASIMAAVFLHERMETGTAAGAVLIFAGVWLVSRRSGSRISNGPGKR
ncbi:MAG: DMT family transporter, partial [Thermoanaerobaculia bacterium]